MVNGDSFPLSLVKDRIFGDVLNTVGLFNVEIYFFSIMLFFIILFIVVFIPESMGKHFS